MKIAILYSGHMRTFKKAYKSHFEKFIDSLNIDYDIFFHTWECLGIVKHSKEQRLEKKYKNR